MSESSELDGSPEAADNPARVMDVARARSGDKANWLNVGVVADNDTAYRRLETQLTADVVAEALEGLVEGEVRRYKLPNVRGFNFVATEALDGGGQVSIRYDTQGKTYAAIVLDLELPPWPSEESTVGLSDGNAPSEGHEIDGQSEGSDVR
jgi:hypothetical protein